VATGEDFAAMGDGDPWHFANPEDVRLLPDRGPIALLKVAGGRAAISDAVVDQLVQLAR
jgi:hypothetical protein